MRYTLESLKTILDTVFNRSLKKSHAFEFKCIIGSCIKYVSKRVTTRTLIHAMYLLAYDEPTIVIKQHL